MEIKKLVFVAFGVFFLFNIIIGSLLVVITKAPEHKSVNNVKRSMEMINCFTHEQCGEHGKCMVDSLTDTTECICDDGYINHDEGVCNYKQKDKLTAFLLSILGGLLGLDRFYLAISSGVAGAWVVAIIKLLTCGGCEIWALIDWILILADGITDPNGVPLKPW